MPRPSLSHQQLDIETRRELLGRQLPAFQCLVGENTFNQYFPGLATATSRCPKEGIAGGLDGAGPAGPEGRGRPQEEVTEAPIGERLAAQAAELYRGTAHHHESLLDRFPRYDSGAEGPGHSGHQAG